MSAVKSSISFILIAISAFYLIEPAIHNEVFSSTANNTQLTPSGESFWTNGPDLPSLVSEHSAVLLEEKIYIIGGEDFIEGGRTDIVRVFDITSNQWSIAPPLPIPLDHSGVSTDGSKIYVVGGFGEQPRRKVPTDRLFIYDPIQNNWQEGTRMPTARGALTADFINGLLYAIGGVNSSRSPVATNEVYDPMSNSWSETTPMPTARHHHTSAVANGQLYIIGGRILGDGVRSDINEALTNLNDNEKFDPVNKTWSIQEQMPTKRSGMAAEVSPLNGNIYVFGGESLTGAYNITEKYVTNANKWSPEPNMPTPRLGLEAIAIDDKIYLFGGKTDRMANSTNKVDVLHINN
jgi:N-acetylneuraminic acid mutarotase